MFISPFVSDMFLINYTTRLRLLLVCRRSYAKVKIYLFKKRYNGSKIDIPRCRRNDVKQSIEKLPPLNG